MDPRQIASLLAEARLRTHLSQAEVAARMRTTQSAISRAETGRITPTLDFMERYARALGLRLGIRIVERGTRPSEGELRFPNLRPRPRDW